MGIFDLFKRKASPQESVSGEDPQDEGKKNTSNLEMDSERDVRRTQRERGRIGDEDSTAPADPLEGGGDQTRRHPTE